MTACFRNFCQKDSWTLIGDNAGKDYGYLYDLFFDF